MAEAHTRTPQFGKGFKSKESELAACPEWGNISFSSWPWRHLQVIMAQQTAGKTGLFSLFCLVCLSLMVWCSGCFSIEGRVSEVLQEIYSQSTLREQIQFHHFMNCQNVLDILEWEMLFWNLLMGRKIYIGEWGCWQPSDILRADCADHVFVFSPLRKCVEL